MRITKIDETTTDRAEDLDLVMPVYNLLEYSLNYSHTTGSLWFYSKDEATNFNANIVDGNVSTYYKYKTKLFGHTVVDEVNGILKNTTIAVPLKYLSNFLRSLEMALTNYIVELKLKSTNRCLLSAAGADNADANYNIIFTIKDTNLYFPVVTLSAKGNQKLPRFLIKRFQRFLYWNKYKTKAEN